MGIQIGFASAGGVVASFIYRSEDAPRFTLGHSVVLGATVIGMVLTIILAFYLRWVNAKKENYCKEHPEVYNEDPHELAKLDEANPLFRYIY